MAAILQLRRGTSTPTLSESELFFNSSNNTLIVGQSSGNHTLVKIGENTGNISFSGDITGSNLSLSGNAVIVGNITLGGDIFLGDGDNTTDKIVVKASLSGSLVPDTDGVYDLGANNKKYRNLHVVSASIDNITLNGSGILSSSQQITDYNTFLEIGGMDVVSGSSQIDLTQTTNYISGIKTRLNSETVISGSSQVQINDVNGFTTFSSSVDGRLDSLESDGDVVDGRLSNLELFSSSQELKDLTLETVTSSFDSRLGNIESFTSSYFTDSASVDSRLDYIEGEFSQSVDSRIDLLESFSSSLDDTFVTTTELHTATSSLSASLTITDTDFESRITEIETTFSSSVDSRLDAQELFSESLDNTYEEKASGTHTLFSGSSQVNADTITNFDTNVKDKLNSDGVISGSSQVTISSTIGYTDFSSSIATTDEGQNDRLDSIEAYTASVDSLYEEISSGTHTLVSGSSQIQINDVTGFTSHSSSVDSRLDSLEGDSHTHSNKAQLDTINQDLSKTSNVTFNNITASGDVVISGDLTVLGNATEIQTSELRIEDKLITVASGSTNSAEADGAGIEIDGAGKSIIWDDATQSFILNAKVSSSVGFKGDGSELIGVTAADVEYLDVLNKPTLVSGSTQISFIGITDKPTLFSGSDQVTASLDSRYLEINGDNVFSGSTQVNADTITNFDLNVKDKMNLDNVISGSSQITDGSGILSSSNENFTQFSSSIDSRVDSLETTFSSSVDSRLGEIETTFSSSVDSRLDAQETFSESLDSKYLNTNGDNVVSGSTGDQLTASLDLRYEEISSGTHTLVSGSSQIDVSETQKYSTLATTGSNNFIGNQDITGSLYVSGSNIEIQSPITSSNTIEATFFYGDGSNLTNVVASELSYENITNLPSGLVSHSSQIDVTQTQNYSSIRQYDDSNNTTHLNSLGVVSGSTYSSPSQGTVRATINGVNSDVDLGLQSTDTPIFSGIQLNSITQVSSGSEFTVLLQSSSNEIISSELGGAAFYHVSNSIDDGNPEVLGDAGAVKAYVDSRFIAASAGDITEVNAGPGLGGGSTVGAATLNLDTGSQHFIDGVKKKLDVDTVFSSSQQLYDILDGRYSNELGEGVVSGSDQVTQSLDTRYVNVSGDTISGDLVISGDLTVNGTTTTINTTNLNVEDNIIELNYGGSATTGGIIVKDVTGVSTISGSLLWDADNDYWVAGQNGLENEILTTNNSTTDLTEGTNLYYTDTRVKDKLNTEGVLSGSIDGIYVTNSKFNTYTASIDSINVNQNNRLNNLESFSSSLDDGFVTEVELNTATQSLQESIDTKLNTGSYNTDSQSFDSRLDSLEGVTSENPLTFTDTTTIDFERVGDTITANVIGGIVSGSSQVIGILDSLNSYTSSNDTNQTTQNGRLDTLEIETGSIGTAQNIQDGRLDNLETYTASLDSVYEEKASAAHPLVSGSSQIDVTQTTNYSSINQYSDTKVKLKLDTDGVISGSSQVQIDSVTGFTSFSSSVDIRINSLEGDIHTHTNKSNLDTINQNLSTTSNVQFNDIQIDGTGSFGSNVTIYGDLTVLGTETIINTENLAIADNMIYLNSGSTVANPDLGWAGNYNDGTYAHLGLFSDASDNNTFKVYKGYTPEPEGTIDTAHASFELADFQSHKNTSVTSSTELLQIVSGSQVRTSIEYADGDLGIVSEGGIYLATSAGLDGVYIDANGNTTINGQLTLGEAPAVGSTAYALVWDNNDGGVKYITLGDNALTSTPIPTDTNDLTNGAGYITGFDITTQTDSKYLRSDVADTASGIITFSNTTQSTTNTTGAIIVSGGVGIAKTLNVGEDVVAFSSSDRRLKDNILPISNSLQKINSIGGYSFDWNEEKQPIYKGKDYGVIAQEIEEILPELVDTRENGYKAVKYDKLVSLLIEGIKELSQEVNELKNQINK